MIKSLNTLPQEGFSMPVLFMGHGSPMNGIEDNIFSQQWETLGKNLPVPKAVICISAHWLTRGTKVTAMDFPKTIHDFGGFPQALFDVQYPAPGDPVLAREMANLLQRHELHLDHEWGLDHGSWSVIRRMYPEANIPVLQLSIDFTKPPRYHYELVKELSALRKKGVLIMGSGNIVHNLRTLNWQEPDAAYDWAETVNQHVKSLIAAGDHDRLINFESFGTEGKLAIPTPEHYLPLLYILGLQQTNEPVRFFNDHTVMGSVSMTSLLIGDESGFAVG